MPRPMLSADDGVGGLGVIGTPAQMPSIVNRRRGNGGLIAAIIFGAIIVAGGLGGAIHVMNKRGPINLGGLQALTSPKRAKQLLLPVVRVERNESGKRMA